MLAFRTRSGYTGYISKEGFLWWKKWKVYIIIETHYKLLEELPG